MQLYTAIGIMSGTSLDGLDIALCNFTFQQEWAFKILKYKTLEYTKAWRKKLSEAPTLNASGLAALDNEYGEYIAKSVLIFLKNSEAKIDLIASHGHTVFHQPEKKRTLQIGNGSQISSITGITTVSDFRSLDVAMGGQGAPLVPIGDKLLFSEYDYCVNIGGFVNISFDHNNKRLAYDICPANIVLNFLANKLDRPYDKNGDLGRSGKINTELLHTLNYLEYYKKIHPKSLAREWLEKMFIPILLNSNISVIDQIATVYEHIASQILISIETKANSKVLVTGGGAYNTFLIDLLISKTKSKIIIPGNHLVEYKEALIFAFLGILRVRNQINCLSSVTGAKKDLSTGVIHQA